MGFDECRIFLRRQPKPRKLRIGVREASIWNQSDAAVLALNAVLSSPANCLEAINGKYRERISPVRVQLPCYGSASSLFAKLGICSYWRHLRGLHKEAQPGFSIFPVNFAVLRDFEFTRRV